MRKSSSSPRELGRSDSFLPVIKNRVSVKPRLETQNSKLSREKSMTRGSDYLAIARRSVFDDFEEYLQRNDEIDQKETKERASTIRFFFKRTQYDGLTGLASNKITDNEQEKMRMQKIKEDTKPLAKNVSVEQIDQARKNLLRNLNMQRTKGGGKILINDLWSQNYQRRIMKYSHLQDLIDRVERKRIKEKFKIRSLNHQPDKSIQDIIQQIRSTPNTSTLSPGWRQKSALSGDFIIEQKQDAQRENNHKVNSSGILSNTSMFTSVRLDESTMGSSFRLPGPESRLEKGKSLERYNRKMERSDMSSSSNTKRSHSNSYNIMMQGFDYTVQKLIEECHCSQTEFSSLKRELENMELKIGTKESKKTKINNPDRNPVNDKMMFEQMKNFFEDKNKSAQRKLTSEEKFIAMWQEPQVPRKSTNNSKVQRKSLFQHTFERSKDKNSVAPEQNLEKSEKPNDEPDFGANEGDQDKPPVPRYKKRVYTIRPFLVPETENPEDITFEEKAKK